MTLSETASSALLQEFIEQESLPDHYADMANRFFLPCVDWLVELQSRAQQPLVIGINGCQGSGKSTLTMLLKRLLSEHQIGANSLSLDDFYLSKADRMTLAKRVHPLLATRGVPGTHDISALITAVDCLKAGQATKIPQFDKATDDLTPSSSWPTLVPGEMILLEGWCIGASALDDPALAEPINGLEKTEDADGQWRRYVNQQLSADYARLFSKIDRLIMLRAPSFEQVLAWRQLQEDKLARRQPDAPQLLDNAKLQRFIQHYERITRDCLERLPEKADYLFQLDSRHQVESYRVSDREAYRCS